MRKILLVLSYFIFIQTNAQDGSVINDGNSSFWDKTELKAGYFGNMLWNPGLSGGAEHLIHEKIKTKQKRRDRRL